MANLQELAQLNYLWLALLHLGQNEKHEACADSDQHREGKTAGDDRGPAERCDFRGTVQQRVQTRQGGGRIRKLRQFVKVITGIEGNCRRDCPGGIWGFLHHASFQSRFAHLPQKLDWG